MVRGAVLIFIISFALYECKEKKYGKYVGEVYDPDMFRNVSTLISSKGYPVEDHTVQTSDGFILSMQRIPHGRKEQFQTVKKQVVFLLHGLLSSAAGWVMNFPEQSLGFILADAGYDVWLGNNRGNIYSKKHIKYTPDEEEFWDFSFTEMAQYDLPAMIDYVLNATGEEKLYYIGHSQGTTIAFALLSESPEYNEKIKLFIALAPVTTVGYITSPIRYLAPYVKDLEFVFDILGVHEFLPDMKFFSELVCESHTLCENIMFTICGADKYQLNETRLGVYSAQLPGGSSTKSVVHFTQMVNSKIFSKFDYGKYNMDHYNQTTPPEYDVSLITTPVALFWSTNDRLADPVDVDILHGKLKSMVSSYCVPSPFFSHLDYIMAVDAHKLVYNEVLSLLSNHYDVAHSSDNIYLMM